MSGDGMTKNPWRVITFKDFCSSLSLSSPPVAYMFHLAGVEVDRIPATPGFTWYIYVPGKNQVQQVYYIIHILQVLRLTEYLIHLVFHLEHMYITGVEIDWIPAPRGEQGWFAASRVQNFHPSSSWISTIMGCLSLELFLLSELKFSPLLSKSYTKLSNLLSQCSSRFNYWTGHISCCKWARGNGWLNLYQAHEY